jgi:hypothetical protein
VKAAPFIGDSPSVCESSIVHLEPFAWKAKASFVVPSRVKQEIGFGLLLAPGVGEGDDYQLRPEGSRPSKRTQELVRRQAVEAAHRLHARRIPQVPRTVHLSGVRSTRTLRKVAQNQLEDDQQSGE